ncbi:MAG: phosphocholine cytidylyltransferase family protein, partial [bacterium]|nr:phosphocholine cytidylyltransferase family protein [bacterium]
MNDNNNKLITTALLLAAGTGSRLYPLTQSMPKCLTMINDTSILERLVICLKKQGFKRLVIVTGYRENCIREFLSTRKRGMKIEYIFSPRFKTTNNLYSLWMAREIINEPFMLVESDLVFDESLLTDMRYPDRIAIAGMKAWMNGSTVTVNNSHRIKRFQIGMTKPSLEIKYKTVNIYSFSLSSWHAIVERLDRYISDGRVNCYYETVLAEMVEDGSLSLQTVSFDASPWYEVDTVGDMEKAMKLFPAHAHESINPYLEKGTRSLSGLIPTPKLKTVYMKPID